ncbi:uncharacterized protein KQ657_002580 [Scheffersomyces spartinae]|uniref:DUF895 domain membrane protein n=1 Tax=Scheffersomyces spartinae TaxID=45513 RepID=A0A9P7V641_9ASCO|nr:uncharacterized protein KQ657_002580 [Scheffersomyces spartinae]KAG7191973.1 hypothetical protein KQ657_002580 [Scheffersomyces spartinae]
MSEGKSTTTLLHENDGHTKAEVLEDLEAVSSNGKLKWYDKQWVSFIPPYSNAMVQVVMLSCVLFLSPGMFNALTGIGASIDDVATSDNANVALYSTFASIGFFSGTILNTIGLRPSMAFGCTGYIIYAGSLLCFIDTRNKGFVIFSGAYLGVCASCLWVSANTILTSYPTEENKGKAIMIFWVIFNLGAVIGSIIPLANNINNEGFAANKGTYVAFIILMCLGFGLAWLMLPFERVVRTDGSKVSFEKHPHWLKELKALGTTLIREPMILLMFPMFFLSNWFYTYQFNVFNAGRFNLRTRSLNSLLYWLSQMLGAIFVGNLLDWQRFGRAKRAKAGVVVLSILTAVIWGGGLKFEDGYTRENIDQFVSIDYTHSNYVGPMFLYMFYGVYDAVFQNYILWIIGALSNDSKKNAIYSGFYKGIQSAGAAIAWRLDAIHKPYSVLFGTSWGLAQASLVIAIPLIWTVKDHTRTTEETVVEEVLLKQETVHNE